MGDLKGLNIEVLIKYQFAYSCFCHDFVDDMLSNLVKCISLLVGILFFYLSGRYTRFYF
jgi:hypothetical protein